MLKDFMCVHHFKNFLWDKYERKYKNHSSSSCNAILLKSVICCRFQSDDANDCNSTNTLNSSVDEIKLDSNASKTIHKNNCGLYIHVHDIYANQTEDIEIKCDPHYKGDIKIQKNHL